MLVVARGIVELVGNSIKSSSPRYPPHPKNDFEIQWVTFGL